MSTTTNAEVEGLKGDMVGDVGDGGDDGDVKSVSQSIKFGGDYLLCTAKLPESQT
jgi:hypothetical protein